MPQKVWNSPVASPASIPARKAHSTAIQTGTPLMVSSTHTAPPVARGAVYRQVRHIQDAEGEVDANGHDAPDEALPHCVRHGAQEGDEKVHG